MKKTIIVSCCVLIILITTDTIAMLRPLTYSPRTKFPVRPSLCSSFRHKTHSEIKELTTLKTSLGNKVLELTKNIEELRSLKAKQDAIDPECMNWLDWS